MKLKTVTLTFDFVIVVEEGGDEMQIARDAVSDAISDTSQYEFDLSIVDYKKGNALDWDEDCIPYGGDGNTPIKDLFTS